MRLYALVRPVASNGTPGDAKCVTEISEGGGTKISKLRGAKFTFLFQGKIIVATRPRGVIFSLKFTKHRLAAGLCPDPLGKLKALPHTP